MSHKQNDTYNEYIMENIGRDNMITKKTIPEKKILANRNMPEQTPDRLEEDVDIIYSGFSVGWCLLLCGILLIGGCLLARPGHAANYSKTPEFTDENVIRSIMGESEGETYLNKLKLASTIYNRGNLKGVCAFKNVVLINGKYYKRVSLKSKYYKRTGKRLRPIDPMVYVDSRTAWETVKENPPVSWKATGWGTKEDVAIFKREGWFKNCSIVEKSGVHYFYKCNK